MYDPLLVLLSWWPATHTSEHKGTANHAVRKWRSVRLIPIPPSPPARRAPLSGRSDKPLLLAICLKEEGRDTGTFQEVINQVLSLGGWRG